MRYLVRCDASNGAFVARGGNCWRFSKSASMSDLRDETIVRVTLRAPAECGAITLLGHIEDLAGRVYLPKVQEKACLRLDEAASREGLIGGWSLGVVRARARRWAHVPPK